MRSVFIPEGYSFKPQDAAGELSQTQAASLQHVAFRALRAALGWHDGSFCPMEFNDLLREESARITGSWEDYKKTRRTGSTFQLDRKTRGAIYVAVMSSRALGILQEDRLLNNQTSGFRRVLYI